MSDDAPASVLDIKEYIEILRRRKLQFWLPFCLVLSTAIALALVLPPTYVSQATILVERQEIPENIVGTTVTGFVQERIEAITQRVLTQDNLVSTAKAAGYDVDSMSKADADALLKEFKDRILVDMVDIEATDPGSSRATTLTIAFVVGAEAATAREAQKIASHVADLYLEENRRLRVEQASEVNDFLESQANILAERIRTYGTQLAEFKQDQIGQLPEQQQMNQNLLERTETRIDTTEAAVRTLQNQNRALQAELRTVDKFVGRDAESANAQSSLERLAIARQELREAKQKYSDLHPNVLRLNAQISSLESEVRSQGGNLDGGTQQATNPEYIRIQSQLAAVRNDLQAESRKLSELEARATEFSERLLAAPLVERDYTSMLREYDTAKQAFEDIKAKQLAAKLASNLEEDNKGQKFTLLEPANTPSLPESPNRIAIIALGLFLAGLLACAFVIIAEISDKTIRGVKGLTGVLGIPPIGVIPRPELSLTSTSRA